MTEHSLLNVAVQAEQLRNAQKAYDKQLDIFNSSRTMWNWELLFELNQIKKTVEVSFDDTIARIINSK